MLGGSASSQTSGAPFRTETDSRATVWPPPAHQNDLYTRGCGIYSLFPGPGDNGKNLYSSPAKSAHSGNPFPGFLETSKVPDAYYSTKFSFGANKGSQFDSASNSVVEPGISRLDLTKPYAQHPKHYSPTLKQSEPLECISRKETRSKRLSDDVVIIKSEIDESNRVLDGELDRDDGGGERRGDCDKRKNGMSHGLKSETDSTTIQGDQTNEPDSTECRISNKNHGTEGIASSEIDVSDKRLGKQSKEMIGGTGEKSFSKMGEMDNFVYVKEKCNIKVIDLSVDCGGKMEGRKKPDSMMNDVCSRTSDKKYVKTKTPDSSCKNLTTNYRQYNNETSKPSPTRTLALPSNNGGCSRTTPVTFKHLSQQDPEVKCQNGNVDNISSLAIKKEPMDFQKYSSNSPFFSFTPLDGLFNSSSVRVPDGQLLSAVPYSDSYESSSRVKETFLSPRGENTYLSSSQSYSSPIPVPNQVFLSRNLEHGEFSSYDKCGNLSKMNEEYLMNSDVGKILQGSQSCLPVEEDRIALEGGSLVNSTTSEREPKNVSSKTTSCSSVNVTPCQVAEVTSASSLLSPKMPSVNPVVIKQEAVSIASGSGMLSADQKQEVTFTASGQSTAVSSTVGISLTRQRCQPRRDEIKMSLSSSSPPPSVLHRTVQSPASINISPAMGAVMYPGGMTCGDRSATIWPTPPHNPGLWQYSAPIDYPPFPPVGFQLVRDPITGHFLLIPTSNLEALQRAILWPSFAPQPTPSQMIIPPIPLQPNTPHLLLDNNMSAVDFLSSDAGHRESPQQRILITAENAPKRKMMGPALIKLEASDVSNAAVATTCDSGSIYTKSQSATPPPRGNALHFPQISSGLTENVRSQANSAVPCLTSVMKNSGERFRPIDLPAVSNHLQSFAPGRMMETCKQTDTPLETEDEGSQTSIAFRNKFELFKKSTESHVSLSQSLQLNAETSLTREPEDDKKAVLKEIQKRKEMEDSLNINISNVPDVNIKKEIISPSQVDLSGLELLSSSAEQLTCESKCKVINSDDKEAVRNSVIDAERKDLSNDACEGAVLLQNLKNGFRELDTSNGYESVNSKSLGGLGLLCALAEQRFQEEIHKEIYESEKTSLEEEEEQKEEKENKEEQNFNNENEAKESVVNQEVEDCESYKNYQDETDEYLPKQKRENEEVERIDNGSLENSPRNKKLRCDKVEEVSKENLITETPNQSEESQNSPSKRGPGRPKKIKCKKLVTKFSSCQRVNRNSKEMSPPILEKQTDYSYKKDEDFVKLKYKTDVLKPPTLTPSAILDPVCKTAPETLRLPPCEVTLTAVKIDHENVKRLMKSETVDSSESESKKRKMTDSNDQHSSSKKRKVGRPKKHHLLTGSKNPLTETIVAKKPKTKSNYVFPSAQSAENLVYPNAKSGEASPEKCVWNGDKRKSPFVKVDSDSVPSPDSPLNGDGKDGKSKKIRPKLKAEPKIKEWTPSVDDANAEWRKNGKTDENVSRKTKVSKKTSLSSKGQTERLEPGESKKPKLPSCVLTTEHIKSNKFPVRTLTAMGGLFYAGHLSAIRAPDVYGITIDGERGNRPHIYSREEILKDSILEVKPEKASDLVPGTRCCAYWSEQYRCLYPGTVSTPASPNPELDNKFVNVEFDDGDSGRINIDDIRLLPEDYPIVEYDPNPLQSLTKRRRRVSGTSVESHSKERKSGDSLPAPEKVENGNTKASEMVEYASEEPKSQKVIHICETVTFLNLESERKHLKKKRREKLKRLQSLSVDGKKKHKKHRCSDEHRHHKHHKKHRKHKHKHGKRRCAEVNSEGNSRENELEENETEEKPEELKLKKKLKSNSKSVDSSRKPFEKSSAGKPKKCKKRTESVESRSKMAAFLPARQLWGWSGKGYKRPGAKGRARKEFYKTIQRGKERITVGDCAVFLSTGRPDRPYIGRIESMWESWGTNMIVRVKWFYHPEETVGCPATLEYPGALFESPHVDENDVQTISHKCEVLPLKEYTAKIGNSPHRYETIYDNNDIYYLAGYYDPTNTTLKMEPGVK